MPKELAASNAAHLITSASIKIKYKRAKSLAAEYRPELDSTNPFKKLV